MSSDLGLRRFTLGELVEVSQGLAINAKTKHLLASDGLPLLRITDLINGEQVQFVNIDSVPAKCIATERDIIYTRTGQVGLVFRGKNGVIHNNCFKVIPNVELIDPDYLYWFLSQDLIKKYANDVASGSVQKDLNHSAFKSIQIKLPNLDYQKTIGPILNSLAEKIELNRQTNQTLEQIAQALFKSWFVDFEPTRAKIAAKEAGASPEEIERAAMCAISGKTPNQLAQLPPETQQNLKTTAALFPDALVDSELGEIPKGWEVQELKQLAEKISKGTTPTKSDEASAQDEKIVPFLKVRDISDLGEISRTNLDKISESVHTGSLKRSVLLTNDLLFSIAGTIGRVALVEEDLNNSNCNQALAYIRLKETDKHLELCRLYLRSPLIQEDVASKVVQGVQANFSLTALGEIKLLIPNSILLEVFEIQVGTLCKQQRILSAQSRRLAEMRDTLLPKLLSGEIEVSNVN